MASPRGRRRRSWRRDRPDVQRAEVGVRGVGARRRVAAPRDRGRARRGRQRSDRASHRDGADRAPPLRRAGRRGARPGPGGRRVPAHHRARRPRGRRARPAAAQPCGHHERDPRGRADRRGRLPADLPLRPRARRLLPLGARAPAPAARVMRSSGAPANMAATSRSPACRAACWTPSPPAAARSPEPPSASARSGAAHPSAASCAQLKLENRKAKVLVTRADLQQRLERDRRAL